jgi:hypothetical protein
MNLNPSVVMLVVPTAEVKNAAAADDDGKAEKKKAPKKRGLPPRQREKKEPKGRSELRYDEHGDRRLGTRLFPKPGDACQKCRVAVAGEEGFGFHYPYFHCKECKRAQNRPADIKRRSSLEGYMTFKLHQMRKRRNTQAEQTDVYVTLENLMDMWKRQEGRCAMTGTPMTHSHLKEDIGRVITNASVDRIDSKKPYTLDNIHFVCAIVNRMKWEWNKNLFVTWCIKIADYAKATNRDALPPPPLPPPPPPSPPVVEASTNKKKKKTQPKQTKTKTESKTASSAC